MKKHLETCLPPPRDSAEGSQLAPLVEECEGGEESKTKKQKTLAGFLDRKFSEGEQKEAELAQVLAFVLDLLLPTFHAGIPNCDEW